MADGLHADLAAVATGVDDLQHRLVEYLAGQVEADAALPQGACLGRVPTEVHAWFLRLKRSFGKELGAFWA
ncbi:MAG: hypothetical protein WDN04_23220 [Rhodospirillales bacterium]